MTVGTSDEPYEPEEADEPVVASGYRSYEVYQRERVGETTNLVNPRQLLADEHLADPFRVPAVLRENYPCYRDWVGNRFWVTRYDDVTSVFVDDANFETRPLSHAYGSDLAGRDLSNDPLIEQAWVTRSDVAAEHAIAEVVSSLGATADLAEDFADRLAIEIFRSVTGLGPRADQAWLLLHLVRAGAGWDERARVEGLAAAAELAALCQEALADTSETCECLLGVFAQLEATAADIVATMLELDLETLPASLANVWCLLLTHPEQLEAVRSEPRLMKLAYLEALRFAPPQVSADRFTRHEVERFGRLLPAGALMHLSAAAANRDPRQFNQPDEFDISRKDLCQREPRGQYRADGLPAGIVFGHGKPSLLPARPRDAARSRYALTLDIAVAASRQLLERNPSLSSDETPTMSLDRLGGTYRCRSLPTTLGRAS